MVLAGAHVFADRSDRFARGATFQNMREGTGMNVKPPLQVSLESADRPPVNYDRAATYPGLMAQKDVAVPMRDGVNLSVDVYRPEASGKFPALLAFSIYNKD